MSTTRSIIVLLGCAFASESSPANKGSSKTVHIIKISVLVIGQRSNRVLPFFSIDLLYPSMLQFPIKDHVSFPRLSFLCLMVLYDERVNTDKTQRKNLNFQKLTYGSLFGRVRS